MAVEVNSGPPGSGVSPKSRPRWRVRAAGACFVVVVALQAGFALNGYRDPHKFFAFQPFNESSTWRADIERVTWDGRRLPVNQDWGPYQWDRLVHMAALQQPQQLRHAYMGVGATVDFLASALDWVAAHTPQDRHTRHLEARVTYYRNTRGPSAVVLRSQERPRP